MNTREQLLSEYQTYPGTDIICSPGKFEGESLYIPYFWNMNGEDDTDYHKDEHCEIRIWTVSKDDIAIFPDLTNVKYVRLWESSDGFVFSSIEEYD